MGFLASLLPALGAAMPEIGASLGASALPAAGAATAAAPATGLSGFLQSPMVGDVGQALTAANQGDGGQSPAPQVQGAHTFKELLPMLLGEVGANYLGKLQ